MSVEIMSTAAQLYEKSHSKRIAAGKWQSKRTKVTQGHQKWCNSRGHSGLSNNVSILHYFRDITIFTVYVTACDAEKSFSFNTTDDITRYALQFLCKHIAVNICYISWGMGLPRHRRRLSEITVGAIFPPIPLLYIPFFPILPLSSP